MSNPTLSADQRLTPSLKTLSCIEHVLRLYWSPERFDADPKALEWLLDHELIEVSGTNNSWWRVTTRGAVYVEAIRELQLPVKVTEWKMP